MSEIGFLKNTEAKVKGNNGYVNVDASVYTFEVMASQNLASPGTLPFYNSARRLLPMRIGDIEFIPEGENNRMPEELREILDENNQTPGVLKKVTGLIWGQGPAFFEERFEEGKRKKFWSDDVEIEKWLNDWDYEEYLQKTLIEFVHMDAYYSKYYRNMAPRIGGKGMINRLEHVSSAYARLGWAEGNNPYTYIVIGDFYRPHLNGVAKYPLFDKKNPFLNPVSASYSSYPNFALDKNYSRPSFWGNLNTMKLQNSITKVISAFNLNSASIKYHIQSPSAYWKLKQEKLQEKCLNEGTEYTDKLLDDLKANILADFAKSLTGIDMAGKMLHTEKLFDDELGEYVEWTINVLDQKVKNFIDAQLAVLKSATLQTHSGLGLHPALSGMSTDGNLPSGSEQLYAFKFYLLTSIDIQESIICRDINNAIKANFPNSKKKIGFYHDTVMTEEQTSPKDRIKNQ